MKAEEEYQKLEPGQKVTYDPNYDLKEHGIVKQDDGDFAFVVYHCNEEWDRYEKYTAARTHKKFLKVGWV